jgi:hypothetical protein
MPCSDGSVISRVGWRDWAHKVVSEVGTSDTQCPHRAHDEDTADGEGPGGERLVGEGTKDCERGLLEEGFLVPADVPRQRRTTFNAVPGPTALAWRCSPLYDFVPTTSPRPPHPHGPHGRVLTCGPSRYPVQRWCTRVRSSHTAHYRQPGASTSCA